ncbi:MAG: hypothetical protein JW881_13655 [Spirochaetales bacterium]|nr:hypothetical protein [Spirochaetales bacterium]
MMPMNSLGIENLKWQGLEVDINDSENSINIRFRGAIDMILPDSKLNPYFTRIHSAVVTSGFRIIVCDVRELDFINSSGIRCFLKWVMSILQVSSDKRYTIIFQISREMEWQEISLGFIKRLAPDCVKIESK